MAHLESTYRRLQELYSVEQITDFMTVYGLEDLQEEFEGKDMAHRKRQRVYFYYDVVQTKQCAYCKQWKYAVHRPELNVKLCNRCWMVRHIELKNLDADGGHQLPDLHSQDLLDRKEATLGVWYLKKVQGNDDGGDDAWEPSSDDSDSEGDGDADGDDGDDGDEENANEDAIVGERRRHETSNNEPWVRRVRQRRIINNDDD